MKPNKIIEYFKTRDDTFAIEQGIAKPDNKTKLAKEIEFIRNNNSIKDENDSPIDENEFKKIIKSEVSKFIYTSSNIVLLAGAGSSIINTEEGFPDKNYGHTIQMLADEVNNSLKNNECCFTLHEMCEFSRYSKFDEEDFISGDFMSKGFILEDFLSKALVYSEYVEEKDKGKYNKTINKILQIIVEKTSYTFDSEVHNHAKLINILNNLVTTPERLSIVTTNYDTLFEEAAESLDYTIFDGFSFSSKPKFNVDLFDWSLVKPIYTVKSDKVEYKKSSLNLLKIHGSLTWSRVENQIIRGPKVTTVQDDKPIMIFPSSNKYTHSYEAPYFELFAKFQELIKKPNTLLITAGFSFADNHIAKMITQAIKTAPSLSVLATDYDINSMGKNANWKDLEKMMNQDYRIAFLKSSLSTDLVSYFGSEKNVY